MAGLHIGFAMASKRLTPEVPLAVLIAAEELLDLLCLVFLPTGMEKNGAYLLSSDFCSSATG